MKRGLSKGGREGRGGRKRGSWNEATEGCGGRGVGERDVEER
jgi:hypothetical protein